VPATVPRALIRSEFSYFKFDERNVPIESEATTTYGPATADSKQAMFVDPLAPPVSLDRMRSTSPPSANVTPHFVIILHCYIPYTNVDSACV
jgi:hypothetical protein